MSLRLILLFCLLPGFGAAAGRKHKPIIVQPVNLVVVCDKVDQTALGEGYCLAVESMAQGWAKPLNPDAMTMVPEIKVVTGLDINDRLVMTAFWVDGKFKEFSIRGYAQISVLEAISSLREINRWARKFQKDREVELARK